ncbi:MAG: RHS repeat protein [Pirellulales bacterium]|nr:RHS repeat protein [Pirellulales bacterium]
MELARGGTSKGRLDVGQRGLVKFSNTTFDFSQASRVSGPGTIMFSNVGSAASPQRFETMSRDEGNVPFGYSRGYPVGGLAIEGSSYVQMMDCVDNSTGVGAEALYVDNLVVAAAATLDLNLFHAYARSGAIYGTVIGGSLNAIPDGGRIDLNTPTSAAIAVEGEVDEWTFFGYAGRGITVIANPGTGGDFPPSEPTLDYAQVRVFAPSGSLLAAGTGSSEGEVVRLVGIELTERGEYRIEVSATAGQPSSRGNYNLSIWNATFDVAPLIFGQPTTGTVDTAYSADRWTFSALANQQVQFDLIASSSSSVQFKLSGPNGWTGFSDLAQDSGLITLPEPGSYALEAYAVGGDGGSYSFQLLETLQTGLTLGAPYAGTIAGSGHAQLFRVEIPEEDKLIVFLDDASDANQNELYIKLGAPPTRADYAYRFDTMAAADQQIIIPVAHSGVWYILIYSQATPNPGQFSLVATTTDIFLRDVTPDYHGDGEDITLTLIGVGFDHGTTVELVAADETAYSGIIGPLVTSTRLSATFPSGSVPPGVYSVRVADPGGDSSTLADTFEVRSGGAAHLETELILPRNVGRHTVATLYVEYANTGTNAMPAPLLVLRVSDRALMTLDESRVVAGFWTSAIPDGYSDTIEILGCGVTPGVLQPGERLRVPVYYAGLLQPWDMTDRSVDFAIESIETGTTTPIDWEVVHNALRPASIPVAAWDVIFANLVSQIGSTWGDYVRMLDENAAYLGGLGRSVVDVSQLWQFEVQQAAGLSPLSLLATAVDADVSAPQIPLTFGRSFLPSLVARHELGPFGRGWYLAGGWQRVFQVESDGTVAISGSGGGQRRFEPDSRGGYFSQTGDNSQLKSLGGGGFTLREANGLVTCFRPDGKVEYVEETNGVRITAGYDGDQLTSLTHSSGRSLQIAYNAAGRIECITDPFGRTTLYSYDTANEHLTAVTGPGGLTTHYTYGTGGGPAIEHALLSIEYPDGSHRYFTYDAHGRLESTSRDGGAEAISFSYDSAGTVAVTDAAGGTTKYFFDHRNLVGRIECPLNHITNLAYDVEGNLTAVEDTLGQTSSYAYDAAGNLTRITDPLGQSSLLEYSGPFNRLSSATGARGNSTQYTYDAAGNLTSIIRADNSVERFRYDSHGNVDTWINCRGQAVHYTFNADGQLQRKDFVDGSSVEYTYNDRGNLGTAVDVMGTTCFEYLDPIHPDLVTRITYPSGRFLEYTYEDGQRVAMVDQDDFTTTYHYDVAGRLESLRDGSDQPIAQYDYDAAGRIDRCELGNGTYTTYEYDLAGRLEHLVNHAPDTSVNSRFDYTYDVLGRPSSMTTLEGAWTYAYDALGQLIEALFVSAYPASIPDQNLEYGYDAAGNRVRTIINGVTTEYTTNDLDQYIQVGESIHTYDPDGNLVAESGGTTNATYTYDTENRLIGLVNPSGAWTYHYDALGNRFATEWNGERTEYLLDPFELADVVAEYGNSGDLLARYVHGLNLASRVDSAGTSAYYDFDATGSTAGISNAAGTYINEYSYLPFGERLQDTEAVTNPFQYVGAFGIMTEANGLDFMRARFYRPLLGAFTSSEPSRLPLQDRYLYTQNSPLAFIDPTGFSTSVGGRGLSTADNMGGNFSGIAFPDTCLEGFSDVPYPNLPGPVLDEEDLFDLYFPNPKPAWSPPDCDPPSGPFWPEPGEEPEPFFFPPDPPPGASGGEGTSDTAGSIDPNQKTGSAGFGPEAFIPPDMLLSYRVDFENDAEATAPAQHIIITDQLSADLDWTTLQFTEVGFGDTQITIPPGYQYFQTTVGMRYNHQDFDVEIELAFQTETGLIRVTFQSIDPQTNLPPDVLTGFLPPEDETGRGMGYFSYMIHLLPGRPSGTEIRNVALITFDSGETIATNQIEPHDPAQGTDPAKEALVTVDAGIPTSAVAPLPSLVLPTFEIHWSGADDPEGSGIANYDLYSSMDGEEFVLLAEAVTNTSVIVTLESDHTYAFYTRARDNVGHVEEAPCVPDTTTSVVGLADFNANGIVDSDDLQLWEGGFGTTEGAIFSDGDADTDGDVDGNDFLQWQRDFGELWGTGSADSTAVGSTGAGSLEIKDNANQSRIGISNGSKSSTRIALSRGLVVNLPQFQCHGTIPDLPFHRARMIDAAISGFTRWEKDEARPFAQLDDPQRVPVGIGPNEGPWLGKRMIMDTSLSFGSSDSRPTRSSRDRYAELEIALEELGQNGCLIKRNTLQKESYFTLYPDKAS